MTCPGVGQGVADQKIKLRSREWCLALSRAAAHASKKVEHREDVFFILLFGIVAVAAALAGLVNLPDYAGYYSRTAAVLRRTFSRILRIVTGEEMSYVDFA